MTFRILGLIVGTVAGIYAAWHGRDNAARFNLNGTVGFTAGYFVGLGLDTWRRTRMSRRYGANLPEDEVTDDLPWS